MYGRGLMHSTDSYVPDPVLLAKRAKSIQNQSSTPCTTSGQKPVGRANEKSESTNRSASTSSEKSSTWSSNERRSRSDNSQKPPPHVAGGAKLSYDNIMHDLLENSKKSTQVINILNNRKSTIGGVCLGSCVMNTVPPTLMSVTSSDSSSRANYLYSVRPSRYPRENYGVRKDLWGRGMSPERVQGLVWPMSSPPPCTQSF